MPVEDSGMSFDVPADLGHLAFWQRNCEIIAKTSPKRILILCALVATLTACTQPVGGEPSTTNFNYWSNAPGNTCAKMGGQHYCVRNEEIRARSFETDPAPGFLVEMPISDPELIKCNRQRYLLKGGDDTPPSMQLSFGDQYAVQDGKVFDTTKKYYERMVKNLTEDDDLKNWENPKSYSQYYGLSCIRYKRQSFLHEEMLCHGGTYGSDDPPFFFSCNWDGAVPFPGCSTTLFVEGLHLRASYSKTCAPNHLKIKSRMIEYIKSLQLSPSRRNSR